jgi:glycine/D-amino acid oxidase-like deaminating enzyme
LPGRPQVLHVGGWCGHGIALGVAAGKWVASLLAGQAMEELPWFRPQPPGLPLEVVRRLAFAASVRMMAWLDN